VSAALAFHRLPRFTLVDPVYSKRPGKYISLDCEFVGIGPEGTESALARVSIVNFHGAVVLDTFVKTTEKVVDYRTWVSGVREGDLRNGMFYSPRRIQSSGRERILTISARVLQAPSFKEVQKQVSDILKGRVLVGHAVQNDLSVCVPFPVYSWETVLTVMCSGLTPITPTLAYS
jgi:RNA exonuclease 4